MTLTITSYGVCISVDGAGYAPKECDFLELPARELVRFEGSCRKELLCRDARPIYALNQVVPSSIPLVGPDRNAEAISELQQRSLDVANSLGVKIITIGSGSARRVPRTYPRSVALKQFAEFMITFSRLCQESSIALCLEPLRPSETNLITSLQEAVDFLRTCCPGEDIYLTLDPLHVFYGSRNDLSLLRGRESMVRHVHICDYDRNPLGDESRGVLDFLAALNGLHYNGALSLECNWSNYSEQLRHSLNLLAIWVAELDQVSI